MRRKSTWLVLFCSAMAVIALYHVGKVHATPSSGFTATTLALGRFGPIKVLNHFRAPSVKSDDREDNIWTSSQKTNGQSDLYIQSNIWQPGGSTGWHSHPGHSLIIVNAGTLTEYEGDDPSCTPTVYTQGMGFVDPGGGHVHIIRNEGTEAASTIAVQLIPADQARRIDVPDPGNCHF